MTCSFGFCLVYVSEQTSVLRTRATVVKDLSGTVYRSFLLLFCTKSAGHFSRHAILNSFMSRPDVLTITLQLQNLSNPSGIINPISGWYITRFSKRFLSRCHQARGQHSVRATQQLMSPQCPIHLDCTGIMANAQMVLI